SSFINILSLHDALPILEVVLSSTLLCNHLHIPLQSGSGKVLSLMNRNYSPDDYAGLISLLRSGRPDLALTTDLMVGFPGETEARSEEHTSELQSRENLV